MIAIEHLLQQPAAQAIGWALLQFVWQGALVGLLSAAALVALRRSAADVRYVVAAIGLSLMLTMPVVTAVQAWRSMTASAAQGDSASTSPIPVPSSNRGGTVAPPAQTAAAPVAEPPAGAGRLSASRPPCLMRRGCAWCFSPGFLAWPS